MNVRILALLITVAYSYCAEADSLFSIGNSLTVNGVTFFPEIVAQNGQTVNLGTQIRSGAALNYIRSAPNDITPSYLTPYGAFNNALPNYAWDYVSIEPYPEAGFGTNNSLGSDMSNISYFIDMTKDGGFSNNAAFFVYEAWPSQASFGANYQTYWQQPTSNQASQTMVFAKQYFDDLHAGLTAQYSGSANINVIPVGDVLNRLDAEFKAGLFSGFSDVKALYLDNDHLNNIGRFVAATTVYDTLYKTASGHINIPAWWLNASPGTIPLTDNLAQQLQSVVWEVVANDPRAGVTAVPVPAAIWLFASGLAGIATFARRKQ